MIQRQPFGLAALALSGIFACAGAILAETAAPDFRYEIRPLLAKNCFACHGPDEAHRAADLRLDIPGAAVEFGAIVPGSPDESELIRRITSDEPDERMPPPDSERELSIDEIEKLTAWISTGAEYSGHWSYEAPKRPSSPEVANRGWCNNDIDRFILARLEAAGLRPELPADRHRLIRRVSLDIIGLPPTIEEVEAFAKDQRPDAYERLVDRLLASPAYGEHWARLWLDIARYADTTGYEKDARRTMWPYRDWVINALNADMPFTQFTIEQLAGDLLPAPTNDQIIATAFHRNTMQNDEGGTDDEEYRVAAVVDRVNTTMQAWMGTTMGCCQCHFHKYDPITHQEYYQLFAFFNQTADADRPDQEPTIPALTAEQQRRKVELDRELEACKREHEALFGVLARDRRLEGARVVNINAKSSDVERVDAPSDATTASPVVGSRLSTGAEPDSERGAPTSPQAKRTDADSQSPRVKLRELAARRKDIERRISESKWDKLPIMRELPPAEQRTTHVHVRGSFLDKGEIVEPDTPEAFPPFPEEFPRNRLGLARWLVARDNPLTARVVANRQWEQIFRTGIVLTSEDFGSQGMLPSHPELLDWLAVELMDNGWSLKKLTKTIVMSAAYRQSSRATPEKLAIDPDNRLISRGSRGRLTAEQIRDQALAVSGLLSHKIGGPSVMPPQPAGVWQVVYSDDRWITSEGEDRYRRGLYTFWRRTSPYPSAMALDAPSRETCTIRRIATNTPVAAFALLNDPVYVEAAQALARRIMEHDKEDAPSRAAYGFRRALARPPETIEVERLVRLFESERAHYAQDNEAATAIATSQLGMPGEPYDMAELAAWTLVSNVLLNLDETLTK